METGTNKATELPPVAKEYNGIDRNAWVFGWNPQQELWNGRERSGSALLLTYFGIWQAIA